MKEGSALAAIDIGSNSILLETARMERGQIRMQMHRKETVRLGGSLNNRSELEAEAMQRGWECLERFAQLIAHIPPSQRRVAATQTLREAVNRDVFLARASEILQCPVELISGEEESRLIYQGVSLFLPNDLQHRLVVDIGGRSSELAWGQGPHLIQASSFPLGSVGWAQRFFAHGDLSATAFQNANAAALELLAPAQSLARKYAEHPHAQVYGASGTAGAISKVLGVQGHAPGSISREALFALRDLLQSKGHVKHLGVIQGLRPELVPVIGGGISVMCAMFDCLQLQHMRMAQGALRHGLLASIQDNALKI